jgi:hypothetical protein
MPEVQIAGPFDKLELPHENRLEPSAFRFHEV